MPSLPKQLSNEELGALRTVSQKLGRQLSDTERTAVLYEHWPQQYALGMPVNANSRKTEEAEHAALRERLLVLLT